MRKKSFRIIDHAINEGVNFIDTADVYAGNESERILGKALAGEGKRDNIILATKFNFANPADRNARGLSRRHVINACDASLKRLNTEWIDLYQMHRCSSAIPIDETLRALDDLVRRQDTLYRRQHVSSMANRRIALGVAKELGLNRLICEQPAYHLLDRTAEREVIPAAQSFGWQLFHGARSVEACCRVNIPEMNRSKAPAGKTAKTMQIGARQITPGRCSIF